jgi:hypothetical protein
MMDMATYAQGTTYRRLFAAREALRSMMRAAMTLRSRSPSQGRFLPRLRATSPGVAFFVSQTVEALVFTASTSPYTVDGGSPYTCYNPASSRQRAQGLRHTAQRAAGKHVTTRVLRTSPLGPARDAQAGRSRVGRRGGGT